MTCWREFLGVARRVKVVRGVSRRVNAVERKGAEVVHDGRLLLSDVVKANEFVGMY
mgnify:CR=1 FL=1